ncbi:hypothetical protein EJ06DRAFT_172986 [Trichodelitschia bisporula]|uniref:Uncharacterized protein n=1 Tax=Trichodelitschia bisporula TaxID=703511 RepID=A0A6G1HLV5_9PEZI|nr:hypothetical protein EJ06DRAFT_172986 [Trichodelitschia bisporula]
MVCGPDSLQDAARQQKEHQLPLAPLHATLYILHLTTRSISCRASLFFSSSIKRKSSLLSSLLIPPPLRRHPSPFRFPSLLLIATALSFLAIERAPKHRSVHASRQPHRPSLLALSSYASTSWPPSLQPPTPTPRHPSLSKSRNPRNNPAIPSHLTSDTDIHSRGPL